jgi:hypothetical protein
VGARLYNISIYLFSTRTLACASLANMLTFAVRPCHLYLAMPALTLKHFLQLAPPLLKAVLTTITNALSTILICRLMLNVRDPALQTATTPSTSSDGDGGVISTVIHIEYPDTSFSSSSAGDSFGNNSHWDGVEARRSCSDIECASSHLSRLCDDLYLRSHSSGWMG